MPIGFPLTTHWKLGEAPLLLVEAANVAVLPSHTGLFVVEIEIFTVKSGYTVKLISFEVAGLLEMQTVSEELRMQQTVSSFDGE